MKGKVAMDINPLILSFSPLKPRKLGHGGLASLDFQFDAWHWEISLPFLTASRTGSKPCHAPQPVEGHGLPVHHHTPPVKETEFCLANWASIWDSQSESTKSALVACYNCRLHMPWHHFSHPDPVPVEVSRRYLLWNKNVERRNRQDSHPQWLHQPTADPTWESGVNCFCYWCI